MYKRQNYPHSFRRVCGPTTLRAEHPFQSSSWSRRRRGDSAWIASILWSSYSLNFRTSQSCIPLSNWVFVCKHLSIDKPMFTTETAVSSARILGLGSKLYASNMQSTKIIACFMQSLSQVQNQLSKRKALLTEVKLGRLGREGETFPLDTIVSTTSLQT